MPLILAVDNDKRQSAQLASLLKASLDANLVQCGSSAEGLDRLCGRVPDLILTSSLLSPRDDAALSDYLRRLGAAAAHVQTLTIPVLASGNEEPVKRRSSGVLGALRRERTPAATPRGCDPAVFAQEVQLYLSRAIEQRVDAVADPAETPTRTQPVATPEVERAVDVELEANPDDGVAQTEALAPAAQPDPVAVEPASQWDPPASPVPVDGSNSWLLLPEPPPRVPAVALDTAPALDAVEQPIAEVSVSGPRLTVAGEESPLVEADRDDVTFPEADRPFIVGFAAAPETLAVSAPLAEERLATLETETPEPAILEPATIEAATTDITTPDVVTLAAATPDASAPLAESFEAHAVGPSRVGHAGDLYLESAEDAAFSALMAQAPAAIADAMQPSEGRVPVVDMHAAEDLDALADLFAVALPEPERAAGPATAVPDPFEALYADPSPAAPVLARQPLAETPLVLLDPLDAVEPVETPELAAVPLHDGAANTASLIADAAVDVEREAPELVAVSRHETAAPAASLVAVESAEELAAPDETAQLETVWADPELVPVRDLLAETAAVPEMSLAAPEPTPTVEPTCDPAFVSVVVVEPEPVTALDPVLEAAAEPIVPEPAAGADFGSTPEVATAPGAAVVTVLENDVPHVNAAEAPANEPWVGWTWIDEGDAPHLSDLLSIVSASTPTVEPVHAASPSAHTGEPDPVLAAAGTAPPGEAELVESSQTLDTTRAVVAIDEPYDAVAADSWNESVRSHEWPHAAESAVPTVRFEDADTFDPVSAAAWLAAVSRAPEAAPVTASLGADALLEADVPVTPSGPSLDPEVLAMLGAAAHRASLEALESLSDPDRVYDRPVERYGRLRRRLSSGPRESTDLRQRERPSPPAQDEWGMFDPAQAGPDALFDDQWTEDLADEAPRQKSSPLYNR